MEYYSILKKKKIQLFKTTWIKLGDTMPSEITQRQIMHDVTYIWTLKCNLKISTATAHFPQQNLAAPTMSCIVSYCLYQIQTTGNTYLLMYLDYILPFFF